ncbi:hypothetical protein KY289_016448 [Solanum tuberosum]|nr:hypothetical protein KY289_016448 [Solanum tuberosum]
MLRVASKDSLEFTGINEGGLLGKTCSMDILLDMVKSKEERAKKGHLDKGRKIEDEVAEENGQEAGKYTRREQLRVAELKFACRK